MCDKQTWRPISEAPKDGTYILLFPCKGRGGYLGPMSAYWHSPAHGKGFWVASTHTQGDATYWQPLPLPPEGREEEK